MGFPTLGPPYNSRPGPLYGEGWDRAIIGGNIVPGFSRVTNGGIRLAVDKKKAAGSNGASLTAHGLEPQPLELEIFIWTDEQLEELAKLCNLLRPRSGVEQATDAASVAGAAAGAALAGALAPGLRPIAPAATRTVRSAAQRAPVEPLSFQHPDVDHLGIKAVIVTGMSSLRRGTERGTRTMTISLMHYLPPEKKKNATTTVKGAPKRVIHSVITDGPQSQNPDPTTQQSIAGPPNFTPAQ